jgi:hypothetical protein
MMTNANVGDRRRVHEHAAGQGERASIAKSPPNGMSTGSGAVKTAMTSAIRIAGGSR